MNEAMNNAHVTLDNVEFFNDDGTPISPELFLQTDEMFPADEVLDATVH